MTLTLQYLPTTVNAWARRLGYFGSRSSSGDGEYPELPDTGVDLDPDRRYRARRNYERRGGRAFAAG